MRLFVFLFCVCLLNLQICVAVVRGTHDKFACTHLWRPRPRLSLLTDNNAPLIRANGVAESHSILI